MSRLHYNLPPFTTLSAFEAAARHLSFKNAAQELSVTPGAVSHQIKALEGELGVALFQRKHRGVELTQEGEALFETVSYSFRQISRRLELVRQFGGTDVVTIGSTTAVAALWLSPSVIKFWRDYPDINVHQVTQDRPFENIRDFDFFISYGPAQNPSLHQTPIYRDELLPVAAPELAAQLNHCGLPELAQQQLIRMDAINPLWTRWPDWFARLGYTGDIAPGRRVTSYSVALQIARKGAGVALGWRRLVQPMIESGKLAVVTEFSVPAPHQFYLAGLPDNELSENASKLKTFLLNEAKALSGELT